MNFLENLSAYAAAAGQIAGGVSSAADTLTTGGGMATPAPINSGFGGNSYQDPHAVSVGATMRTGGLPKWALPAAAGVAALVVLKKVL